LFRLDAAIRRLDAADTRLKWPAARGVVVVIWLVGENFGAIFSGSATDPNSGLPLALLAVD
jgi:hypothetical protein